MHGYCWSAQRPQSTALFTSCQCGGLEEGEGGEEEGEGKERGGGGGGLRRRRDLDAFSSCHVADWRLGFASDGTLVLGKVKRVTGSLLSYCYTTVTLFHICTFNMNLDPGSGFSHNKPP